MACHYNIVCELGLVGVGLIATVMCPFAVVFKHCVSSCQLVRTGIAAKLNLHDWSL